MGERLLVDGFKCLGAGLFFGLSQPLPSCDQHDPILLGDNSNDGFTIVDVSHD